MSSWHFYPDNFSSYEEYVKYLKEKGLALLLFLQKEKIIINKYINIIKINYGIS